MDRTDNPEVLAVVPLPSANERRCGQVMLARLLLVAVDMTLAGEPLGLETARDLIREVRHVYPELAGRLLVMSPPRARQFLHLPEIPLHFSSTV
jgi:hypothetical protein